MSGRSSTYSGYLLRRLYRFFTGFFWLLAAVMMLWPGAASSQVLNISSGVHTYTTLNNTTVTMTGRSELHVIAAANPIPGCVIHLNSPDSWFFLPNIRPSAVVASHLGQVRVNGQVATSGVNVRVDEHAMGSVVVPHGPGFLPLDLFSEPHCVGSSTHLGLYTYHTGGGLGAMNNAISSFRLKRGYMATLAQNADGSGASKVYVAQSADLEVGVLPASLDDAVSFVRVFPWRWTGKKGWAGAPEMLVDPLWSYDWDNVATSSTDVEYVPMRHNANWNAYGNINNKQKSTHALGFNEPDRPDQANMTVAAAITQWPNLLASGLRLGAPGVSDSSGAGVGPDWLYSFMAQADALDYRVDFVPIHFYKCNWSATQFYDYLLAIHQNTGRPVWVTEFNNGASWCGGTPPTLEQNAQRIGEFINMLESAPFVERYAIYNWVGAERELVTGGSLTPAGIVYRDKQSSLAYFQEVPPGGPKGVGQYAFDSDTLDRSGHANHGLPARLPSHVLGHSGLCIDLDGTNDFVVLPPNVAHSADFTFAAWVYWDGGDRWQRIFDFGNDANQYMFLTPSAFSYQLRFAITTSGNGAEQRLDGGAFPVGQWTHVAVTLAGNTGRLYVNGAQVATGAISINPSTFNPAKNYLGESQFTADPLFNGRLDEVLIADHALDPNQIAALLTNHPPQFVTHLLVRPDADYGQPYVATIAGEATDPDPGDALTFGKLSGPAWLTVNPDGTLSGTPDADDGGTNAFTVSVTDFAGLSSFAVLTIHVNIDAVPVPNGGFEVPTTSTYIYNPVSRPGAWTYSGFPGSGSGLSANNSAFTSGNAPAPEGLQVAFIQAIASISQPIFGLIPGAEYTVSFLASQRQNKSGGQAGQTFNVTINGAAIGSFDPPQAVGTYLPYAANFTAAASAQNLAFVGTNLRGGDNTVFLDDVRIVLIAMPPPPAPPTNLMATAGDGQVVLQWNASPGALSYNVKRANGSGGPFVEIANGVLVTNYTDLGAPNGVTSWYVLSAVNDGGEGADSAEVSAHPVSSVPPRITVGLSGSAIEIAWPSDHTGWWLESQANPPLTEWGTNWSVVPDSFLTNRMWFPMDTGSGGAFYRLVSP